IAKLVREGTRLNRVQDIAGARIVVPTHAAGESVAEVILDRLGGLSPEVAKDTRHTPMYTATEHFTSSYGCGTPRSGTGPRRFRSERREKTRGPKLSSGSTRYWVRT